MKAETHEEGGDGRFPIETSEIPAEGQTDHGDPAGTAGADDAPLPDAPLEAVLEALLFASEEPVGLEEILAVLGPDRSGDVIAAIEELVLRYDRPGTGLKVQRLAGGYRITTDPRLAPYLRELMRARNRQRLSRAALETLAVVAYKQPITAPEIQEIRGVNPSAILNALLERRLVRILGRKKVVGKPFLYGTTRDFLIRFGLNSLEDLPGMEEFESLIQPEAAPLPFEEPAGAAAPEPAAAAATGQEGGGEAPRG